MFNFLGPKAQRFINIRVQVWHSLLLTSYPERAEISTKYFQGWCFALMITGKLLLANSAYLEKVYHLFFYNFHIW